MEEKLQMALVALLEAGKEMEEDLFQTEKVRYQASVKWIRAYNGVIEVLDVDIDAEALPPEAEANPLIKWFWVRVAEDGASTG